MAPLYELLLAEARRAQAAQAHAQAGAELARARFADALRLLHAGGASTAEIAEALGLADDRVSQLVAGGEGRALSCSFCGRPHAEARCLVAGAGAYICERCVAAAAGREEPVQPDADGRCSFCAAARPAVAATADAAPFRICAECLALCAEIAAEELGG